MTLTIVIIKSALLAVILLSGFAGLLLAERKVLGWFQLRQGPNRVGPWGTLQPVADAVKMIVKEDIVPKDADRLVFLIAPIVSLTCALAAFAVIPVGPPVTLFGHEIPLAVADPGAGLLVLFAVSSVAVYGIALGGWASQSKYALLGSLRSTAQMISYELAMGMSVIGVIVAVGSLRLTDIVNAQIDGGLWFVFPQVLGFLVFYISMFAETSRAPFDLPEAESELVAGYHTEYSGMRFAMFVMAEYIHMITASSLVTLLYLGGWGAPFGLGRLPLPPVFWFLAKVGFLLFMFMWVRTSMPRMRFDRLMSFGWKVLLPVSILNLVGTAFWVVYFGGS